MSCLGHFNIENIVNGERERILSALDYRNTKDSFAFNLLV